VKFGRHEVSEIVRCLPDEKKISPDSSSPYCTDRAQSLPGPAADNELRAIQISSKSFHFRRCYSRMREHHQNGLQSVSSIRLKPSLKWCQNWNPF